MTLVVIAGTDSGIGRGEEREDSARADALLRSLAVRAGTVLVRSSRTGSADAPATLSAAEREIWMSTDQLLGGLAVDGVLRERNPSALIALGAEAAFALGQLTTEVPCWIDFHDDPFDPRGSLHAPWGELEQVWLRHRLLWALERADGVSCASGHLAERLRVALALRHDSENEAKFIRTIVGPSDMGELISWLASPVRRPGSARILSRREVEEIVRASRLEGDVKRLESGRLASAGATGARILRAIRRVASEAIQTGATIAGAPAVATRSFWLRLSKRSRNWLPETERLDLQELERRVGRRPRLLIVMPYRVYPPRHGGAVRLLGQIRELASSCEIHLLRFDQRGECRIERQELEGICHRVEFHHWRVPPRAAPRYGRLPPNAWVFSDERVHSRIRRWIETHGIDVVQFECAEMGQFLGAAEKVRSILVEYDIAFRSLARRRQLNLARRFGDEQFQGVGVRDQLCLFNYEVECARAADAIHVMSDEDARAIAPFVPHSEHRVLVIPNAVRVGAAPGSSAGSRNGVALIGNFEHLPNLDAMDWFVNEIWPRVRALAPGARLAIAGARLPERARDLPGGEGIDVVGEVEDAGAFYALHRVLVVPLRSGSGTRLKILEAFAAGTAVVSTRIGAEGLDVENGVHISLADSAADFAVAVGELLNRPELADRLAAAASKRLAERYDVGSVSRRAYESILRLTLAGPRRGERRDERRSTARRPLDVDVSVVLPVLNGGSILLRVLDAVRNQRIARSVEIVCVDSGSSEEERRELAARVDHLVEIRSVEFNHGLTRDLGAASSAGRVLVFLNQDAVPVDDQWLARLTEPLFSVVPPAAVQGGIVEFPAGDRDGSRRFYWDSGGPRFNFTSESRAWIARHAGIGFSTVNCAIRRDVWERIPFGWIPILEDKAWQQAATEREERIVASPAAAVFHTHGYDSRSLIRRSMDEGAGWRWVGERYTLGSAIADATSRAVWHDWRLGLRRGELRTRAELLFPVLRPWALWRGNRGAGRLFR